MAVEVEPSVVELLVDATEQRVPVGESRLSMSYDVCGVWTSGPDTHERSSGQNM